MACSRGVMQTVIKNSALVLRQGVLGLQANGELDEEKMFMEIFSGLYGSNSNLFLP